jgi:hypothetical protein
MAYTPAELAALKSAFASGVLTVSYEGKTTSFGNADDLLKRIRAIENEIATTAGSAKTTARVASFARE